MTKIKKINPRIFDTAIHVKGKLISSYSFESKSEANKWINTEFPKLQEKYCKLTFTIENLDKLKIGDKCHVWGEGDEVFVIEDLFFSTPNRPIFSLDSGWTEEVHKCYKVSN